jgi:pSer/pThr/pTyr-binding forkhead associated (FHA) protein
MEDMRGPSEGHPLQGPHRDMDAEFWPLSLVVEALGLRIEVHRPDVVVGRHSHAEVRLAFPEISRRHCRLTFTNQQWRVTDLESLNGIYINGERMHEAALHRGDQLRLGELSFLVEHAAILPLPQANILNNEVLQSIADAIKEPRWAS